MAENTKSRKSKRQLEAMVLDLFQQNPETAFSLTDISKILKLKTHPMKMLCADILDDLVVDDFISINKKHCYKLAVRQQVMEGVFQRKRNGRNSFLPDGEEKSILVMERNSGHALNGDRVKVMLLARRRNHTREAEVIEILKRAKDRFVGELRVERNYAFLLTNDRELSSDIFIPKNNLKKGVTGDKAVVEIVDWPEDQMHPVGKVIDILGKKGDNDTEMHAILAAYNLPYVYPTAVENAANAISDKIPEHEVETREDFRDVLTFTIDPHDAKDFDDAISLRSLGKDEWELGVHIADVTY